MQYNYTHNGLFPFRTIAKTSTKDYILYGEKKKSEKSLANLNKGFRTLGISDVTRKKIAFACRTLSFASQPRKVRNGKGEYVKHHVLFITLTLPSEQIGTDAETTKEVLGTFLDRCRKIGLLSNYVWRAEKQNNGNIHYHLLTDTFASYSMFRNLWFISLRKAGYIANYRKKFASLSFEEYSKLPFNSKKSIADISRAYARGTRNGWSEPPAIDVKQINSADSVNAYISKYVSKDKENSGLHVEGRVWGCSQSVSESAKAWKSDKEFAKFWFEAGQAIMRRERKDYDWFSIVLFPLHSVLAWFSDVKKRIENLFKIHFTPCAYWKNSLGLFATHT